MGYWTTAEICTLVIVVGMVISFLLNWILLAIYTRPIREFLIGIRNESDLTKYLIAEKAMNDLRLSRVESRKDANQPQG